MTVAFSGFYQNTKHDIAGYQDCFDQTILSIVSETMITGPIHPGYRDGVILVPIYGFYGDIRSRVVEVNEDTEFVTVCKSRVPGETPRIKTMALADTLPFANYLTAVVYRADVLAEDNDRSTDADWEIITVLTQIDEKEPMHPSTLMANHFKADGGTSTKMSSEDFERTLGNSYNYWKNKSLAITRKEWEEMKCNQ